MVQDRGADSTGRTIAVTFSEAVTAATAEVAGNYTVSGGANVTTATLRVDERTVDLLLDALAIPGTATVDIAAGIEDAAGNASVLAAGQALTSTDATAPAASTIAATAVEGASNDLIVVTFDDDMIGAEVEDLANWTLESPVGTSFDPTGATIAYDAMTRQAQITLTAGANDRNLETGDAIAATFTTMRDVAGNVVTATTIGSDAVNGTVDGDVSSPALLSIVPGAGNTAVLTFTEEVKRMETADQSANGTRIVLTDNSDPGVAATGSVTFATPRRTETASPSPTGPTRHLRVRQRCQHHGRRQRLDRLASVAGNAANLITAVNGVVSTSPPAPAAPTWPWTSPTTAWASRAMSRSSRSMRANVIDPVGMAGGVDPGTATFTATASTATAASGSPFQADVTFGVQPAAGDSILIIGTTDLAGNQMFPVTNAPVVAAVATAPALTGGTAITAVSASATTPSSRSSASTFTPARPSIRRTSP